MTSRPRRPSSWAACAVALGSILTAAGCLDAGAFTCERDEQCGAAGPTAVCAEPGYCAAVSDDCPSGYRFVSEAPSPLSRACVDEQAGSTSTSGPDSTTTTSTSATSGTSTTSASTTSASTSAASGTTDPTTVGTEATTGGPLVCGSASCPCGVEVATGGYFTCVARDDGAMACWGTNANGQLGTGASSSLPLAEPQVVTSATAFVQISAGYNHACARRADDSVVCWGNNVDYRVSPTDDTTIVGPTEAGFVQGASQVSVGQTFTCTVQPPQEVTCWGTNTSNQLGSIEVGNGPYTRAVGSDPVEGLATGGTHACYRTGTEVGCWGRNHRGQLGRGTTTGNFPDPQVVPLPGPPLEIAVGQNFSCALVEGDAGRGTTNSVLCWGDNEFGQLGQGNVELSDGSPVLVPLMETPIALRAHHDVACVRTISERLLCWGGDKGAKLRLVDSMNVPIPDAIPVTMPSRAPVFEEIADPVVDVQVGNRHICALTDVGQLWCWGINSSRQVGPVDPTDDAPLVVVDLDSAC